MLTSFDKSADTGTPVTLTLWWDDTAIRRIELVLAGASGQVMAFGAAPRADLHFDALDFRGGAPTSVLVYSSTALGGSVRRITVNRADGHALAFGAAPGANTDLDAHTDTGITISVEGATICGLFGSTGHDDTGDYLAAIGFSVRAPVSMDDLLRHLNENTDRYSRAIWAQPDELTLNRLLASYRYTPTEPPDPDAPASGTAASAAPTSSPTTPLVGPLGAHVDPVPVAITGNYLAFRWNYPTEAGRQRWLRNSGLVEGETTDTPRSMVAIPSGGVFAEAVLGRSNAAEKLDLTRFWNWQDSPIPILPPEIEPVSTTSRARDLDLAGRAFDPALAQLQQLQALPDPTGLRAATEQMTANIFKDMSNATATVQAASTALQAAASGDAGARQSALDAYKSALAHQEATAKMAIDAAEKILPMIAPELAASGAIAKTAGNGGPGLGGLLPASGPAYTGVVGGTGLQALLGAARGNGSVTAQPGEPLGRVGAALSALDGTTNPTVAGAMVNQATGVTGGPADGSALDQIVRQVGLPTLRNLFNDQPALRKLQPDRVVDILAASLTESIISQSRGLTGDVSITLDTGTVTVPATHLPSLNTDLARRLRTLLPSITKLQGFE